MSKNERNSSVHSIELTLISDDGYVPDYLNKFIYKLTGCYIWSNWQLCVSDSFVGPKVGSSINNMPMTCVVIGRLEQLEMALIIFIIMLPVVGNFLFGIFLRGFCPLGVLLRVVLNRLFFLYLLLILIFLLGGLT